MNSAPLSIGDIFTLVILCALIFIPLGPYLTRALSFLLGLAYYELRIRRRFDERYTLQRRLERLVKERGHD